MDTVVDVIMMIAGVWVLSMALQLLRYHNLRAFYKEDQYAHIPLANRREYAEALGRGLTALSVTLIGTGALFLLESYVNNTYLFWFAQIALIGGIIGFCVYIVKVNKYYTKTAKERRQERKHHK